MEKNILCVTKYCHINMGSLVAIMATTNYTQWACMEEGQMSSGTVEVGKELPGSSHRHTCPHTGLVLVATPGSLP